MATNVLGLEHAITIQITAPVAMTAGVPCVLGGAIVVPNSDAEIGDTVVCTTFDRFSLAVKSGVTFDPCDPCYWNAENAYLTATSTDTYFGIVPEGYTTGGHADAILIPAGAYMAALVAAKAALVASPTNGHVLTTDAAGQPTDSGTALSALTAKAALVASPTNNHLLITDAAGQPTDSGVALTAVQAATMPVSVAGMTATTLNAALLELKTAIGGT